MDTLAVELRLEMAMLLMAATVLTFKEPVNFP